MRIGISTMKEWKKLLNETGSLNKRPKERSATRFPSKELKAYVSEHPDATLEEIAEYFGGSRSGAFDALVREKITFKKEPFYIERDEEKRQSFDAEIASLARGAEIVYIDESGVNKHMSREYGRSPVGERVYLPNRGRRYKNLYSAYVPSCQIYHNKAYEVKLWHIALT